MTISFFILLLISTVCSLQMQSKGDQLIMPIGLFDPISIEKDGSTQISYFSLSFSKIQFADNQTLTISAVSSDHVFISMYINLIEDGSTETFEENLPTLNQNDIQCFNFHTLTCVVLRPWLYEGLVIGVLSMQPLSYILFADIQQIQIIESLDEQYSVELSEGFSAIYMLNKETLDNEKNNEIVIRAEYQLLDSIIDFKMFSIRSGVISSDNFTVSDYQISRALGAYAQELKIIDKQSDIYIIITGENQLQISLSFVSPTNQLSLSEVSEYVYDSFYSSTQFTQFYYNTSLDLAQENKNLFYYGLYVEKLRGDGIVNISACSFYYTTGMQLGFWTYVIIPIQTLTCEDPFIRVQISGVDGSNYWELGLRMIIQPYEKTELADEYLYLYQNRVQVIPAGLNRICQNFTIEKLDSKYNQNLLIQYSSTLNNQIDVNDCQQLQCSQQTLIFKQKRQNKFIEISPTQTVKAEICSTPPSKSTFNSYYSILTTPFPQVKQLSLQDQLLDVINNNQTIFYHLRIENYTEFSALDIKLKLINGDVELFQRCIIISQKQTFQCQNEDDSTTWQLYAQYNVSTLNKVKGKPEILIGVRGNELQSLYSIIANIYQNSPEPEPPGPTPDPDPTPTPDPTDDIQYLKDGVNSISIPFNKSKIFIYEAHMKPYEIQISQELEKAQICNELFENIEEINETEVCTSQHQLQSRIYKSNEIIIRLTNNSKVSKNNATIEIKVSTIVIDRSQPFALSCQKACYAKFMLTYYDWAQQSNNFVSIIGPGFINSTVNNQGYQLKFQTLPFIFTAYLEKAGQLYIEIGRRAPHILNEIYENYELNYLNDLKLIIPVTETFSLLVNSYGRKFMGSWQLFMLNRSQQNTFEYFYPNLETPIFNSQYGAGSVPLILQNQQANSVPFQCLWSDQMKCFYVVHLKNADKQVDILNDDSKIDLSMNTSIHFVEFDYPEITQISFGTVYHPILMLLKQSQMNEAQYQIVPQRISLQPLSSCGSLEYQIIQANTMFKQNPGSHNKYIQVYSTEQCLYSIAVTRCELSITQEGVPRDVKLSKNQDYQTIYNKQADTKQLYLMIWGNSSNQLKNSLVIQVYQILGGNCNISSSNPLYTTTVNRLSQEYSYKSANSQYLINLPISSSENMILIKLLDPSSNDSNTHFSFIMIEELSTFVMLPNSYYLPIIQSSKFGIPKISHYSNANFWQLCLIELDSTDNNDKFSLDITDDQGVVFTNTIAGSAKEECVKIERRVLGKSIVNYTIVIENQNGQISKQKLWMRVKQPIQSIQTYHARTTLYQPACNLLAHPNGLYGHCFNYDITSLQNRLKVIFIFEKQQKIEHENSIQVLGPVIHNLTRINNMVSKKLLAYKVEMKVQQLKQTNIGICLNSHKAFITKVIDQSENFRVILNEQIIKNQMEITDGLAHIHTYKYSQFFKREEKKEQWLVSQVVFCQNTILNNINLLGSPNLLDIMFGNIAQYLQTFKNYSVLSGISNISQDSSFYIGLKSQGTQFNYSILTYKTSSPVLPHTRWSMFSSKITCFQSQDKNHLIIQLPTVENNSVLQNSPNIHYQIYIVPRGNSQSLQHQRISVRCPQQISEYIKNINIFNVSLLNPGIPLFKIAISDLPSRNVSILSKVTINESDSSAPLRYFYTTQNMEINSTGDDEEGGHGKIGLAVLFFIICIAVFLVFLFRFILKMVQRRMRRQNVQFQLSEGSPPRRDTNTTNGSPSRPVQNAGYGEFVDEEITV